MSEKQSGIYQIRNLVNGKKYIGQSGDLCFREKHHWSCLKNGTHGNSHLQRSYNKYGKNGFIFEILVYCNVSDLTQQEQFFINKENKNNLYNHRLKCIDNNLGIKFSNEHNKKISDARTGVFCGENDPNSKLTEKTVLEILSLYFNEGKKQINIAKEYNVTQATISGICLGKVWDKCYQQFMNQDNNNKEKPNNHADYSGENHPRSKLTEKQVFEILDMRYNEKLKFKDIAKKYNVSESAIYGVCYGISWKSCFSQFCEENNINISEEVNNGI